MSDRRKALWRWEPSWYIVLFVFVFITSVLQAVDATVAFVVFLCVTIAVACAIVVAIVVGGLRGRQNPDASGNLSSLHGLTLVRGDSTAATLVGVADTRRHQNAIDAAVAFAGADLSAILVPGSTRWMGIRLRVSVHLVAGERVFHAGYLSAEAGDTWNSDMLALRKRGIYAQVTAAARGERRSIAIELDLGSLDAIVRKGNAQPTSS